MADDPTPQTYMTCNLCGDLVRFDKWGEHLQAHSSPAPPTEREEREPHREICALCHEVSRVGFHVPNDIWEKALHASQIHDIICLACFTRLADERGVAWDGDITFYPVSRVSHDSLRTPTPKQREEREAMPFGEMLTAIEVSVQSYFDHGPRAKAVIAALHDRLRTSTEREEREDAARRLKAFIRKHAPGGCLRLSKGDHCRCPLCDVERLRTHSPEEPEGEWLIDHSGVLHCDGEGFSLHGFPDYVVDGLRRRLAFPGSFTSPEEPVGDEVTRWVLKSEPYHGPMDVRGTLVLTGSPRRGRIYVDEVGETYTLVLYRGKPPIGQRIKCSSCGEPVSTPVPCRTVIRAYIECPECIGQPLDGEEETAE